METFVYIWQILSTRGRVAKFYEEECRQYWQTLTLEQQRYVYKTIRDKVKAGKFVHFNPLKAIMDNLPLDEVRKPTFLRGDEKGQDIVQVLYEGKYKLCSRLTMKQFNLEYVRDWK